jgi:hypothetical protein
MERYRMAGGRNDVSSTSRALAMEPSLRKTEVVSPQSVEEVWFAGCHSDVGGQYSMFNPRPATGVSHSDHSYRWNS